jgi:hypothetical protein
MSVIFDGSNYLTALFSEINALPFTLTCWMKSSELDSESTTKHYFNVGYTGDVYPTLTIAEAQKLVVSARVLRGYVRTDVLSYGYNTNSATNSNFWTHVGLTVKSTGFDFYYKGLLTNISRAITDNFGDLDCLCIGALRRDTVVGHFTGKIAECAIYNGDIGQPNMMKLASSIYPNEVATSNLKFYAPLLSDATVTVGPSLTASGGPSYDSGDHPKMESLPKRQTNLIPVLV